MKLQIRKVDLSPAGPSASWFGGGWEAVSDRPGQPQKGLHISKGCLTGTPTQPSPPLPPHYSIAAPPFPPPDSRGHHPLGLPLSQSPI